jgi:Clp amino terminal domain, pathogenicity island component/Homeodomain-like domain
MMGANGHRLAQLAADAASADDPRAALSLLPELRRELEAFERQQVAHALAAGASFAAIARDLGLSRQAVHRRFRDLAAVELPMVTAPDARRVVRYAREEASALGAGVLRSEHVLLAILRAGDLPAADMLRDAGATLDRARSQVEGASPTATMFRREPGPEDLRALLEAAARQAKARGVRRIEVEDLLAGSLEDPDGGAARTLRALGVDPKRIRRRLAPG